MRTAVMTDDLREYRPTATRPWDRAAASHLLRRSGFAPGEDDVRGAIEAGPRATIDRLLDDPTETSRHEELDALGERLAVRNDIDALRGWWMYRMCHTSRPLHARLSLFWHGHFATSNVKVQSAKLMFDQLRTIEGHAVGLFEDLLLAMSRDPAMVIWLDGNDNVKGRPNENFARELLELFSLGVGNYSETDVQEAARAFTGWHQRMGRFRFAASDHDDGEKSVLGERGQLDGRDIVRIVLENPACSRFIARKLLREFLCPDPPEPLVEAVAEKLRETGFNLGETMRTLLASDAMFEARFYRARIKSPAELTVGIVRSLGVSLPAATLADGASQMGQRLFEPPSVKGWDGHRAWLNSATMLVRLNAAVRVCRGEGATFDAATFAERHGIVSPQEAIRFCGDLALDGVLPPVLERQLMRLEGDVEAVIRDACELLLTSPEYQMA